MKNNTIWRAALMASAAALLPSHVYAQSANADEESADASNSGDIVVTARKREEDIQTVPIAITAYSAESLAQQNISNFNDLSNSTPGVNVTSISGGTTQQIFIRGLAPANTTTDLNVEANVGTFIDGIYQSSRNTLDMISVLDVGQIEIAKGPQSALFGRSTFAGAMSIKTRAPSQSLSGSLSATAGEDKDFRMKGTISGPISETLSARLAAGYLTYDGWGKNSADPSDNLGGTKKYAVNASLLWEPSTSFKARLSGFITHSETEQTPVTLLPLTSFNCGTVSATPATLKFNQLYCGELKASKVSNITTNTPNTVARSRQVSLELEGHLSGVQVVSVTGLTRADNRSYNDYDGTAAGIAFGVCTLGAACSPAGAYTRLANVNLVVSGREKVRTFSQEVRLQSDNDSPFQWIFGANYFDQKIPLASTGIGVSPSTGTLAANERLVQVTQIGTVPTTGIGAYDFTANPFLTSSATQIQGASSWTRASTQTFSIFGSMGYQFGNLRVTAEGRYNVDRKEAQVFSVSNPLSAPGVNVVLNGTQIPAAGAFPVTGPLFAKTFNSFAPRFTLDYKASDNIFLYASAAKGVRAGGFNTSNAVSATGILASEVPYQEETNWTYEAGVKSQWMDKRVTFNASYFHVDWSGAQVSAFTDNPTAVNPARIVRNVGGIKTDGVEVMAEVSPVDAFSFGGSFIYSDVRFGAGTYDGSTTTQCVIGAGATATAATGCPSLIIVTTASGAIRAVPTLEGKRPQRSLKSQWNLHASAELPLNDDWKVSARVDVNHVGSSYNNLLNTVAFGKRTLTNFRLGFGSDRYSLSIWGNNIFNKTYVSNAINQPRAGVPFAFSVPEIYLGEGRRLGMTGTVKF